MFKSLLLLLAALIPWSVNAQTFSGPGYPGGTGAAELIDTGGGGLSVRETILNLLFSVLSYLGLLAVVVLVIVSIMLVISLGNEEALTRVRKVFLYVAIGFIIIVVSDAIVYLVIRTGDGFFAGLF